VRPIGVVMKIVSGIVAAVMAPKLAVFVAATDAVALNAAVFAMPVVSAGVNTVGLTGTTPGTMPMTFALSVKPSGKKGATTGTVVMNTPVGTSGATICAPKNVENCAAVEVITTWFATKSGVMVSDASARFICAMSCV
jgi:hypothetical protein